MNANVKSESNSNLWIMLAGTTVIAVLLGLVVPRLFGSSTMTKSDPHAMHHPASDGQKMSMPGMQGHMQQMREHMAQMRTTTDPQERQRLMDAHMAKMEDMMKMMESMGMGGMGMGSDMKHEGMKMDHGSMNP